MLKKSSLLSLAVATGFVGLWSTGGVVSKIGLQSSSPLALLIVRYVIALIVIGGLAIWFRGRSPARLNWRRAVAVGVLITGLYTFCFLQALEAGMTPGALATILGVQPIITLVLTEKRVTWARVLGLALAFCGLGVVVWDGLTTTQITMSGLAFAALALTGITSGSLLQSRESQPPWVVLPVHYGVGLVCALAMLPVSAFEATWTPSFVLAAAWMGLMISVAATVLLYRLLAQVNAVNVTSLFYLIPGGTALCDWFALGNPMSLSAIFGLMLVMMGLAIVFRSSAQIRDAQSQLTEADA